MIETLWYTLAEQFATNQFLTGATLTGAIAGVIALLRSWLLRAIAWVRDWFTVNLTVHSEDILFLYVSSWLYTHGFDRFSRSYRLRYVDGEAMYGPPVGTFRFFHEGVFVTVSISSDKDGTPSWHGRAQTKELLTISYLSLRRSRTVLEAIVASAVEQARHVDDMGTPIYVYSGGGWCEVTRVKRRKRATVVLASGELERIESDIERFLGNEEWYLDRGVPYRRGYLLTGPPGTGKTSLVRHLAQRFRLPVYISDGSIRSIAGVTPGAILLLEDVDSIARMRQSAEEIAHRGGPRALAGSAPDPEVVQAAPPQGREATLWAPTLSELLNALDGLASVEKVMVIMTTNHPELLDHAMVRPGRVDYRAHLGLAPTEQAVRLFKKFFVVDAATEQRFEQIYLNESLTPAQLQNVFLTAGSADIALRDLAWQLRTEEVCA